MKLYTRTIAALTALWLLAAPAAPMAQGNDTVSNVPFEFTVGTATLPRDHYRISRLAGHLDAFQISSFRHSAIVLSQPGGPATGDTSPRLVFHRYADRYFLREIRLPGNVGFSLPETRNERDAEAHIAGRSTPDVVVVSIRQE